MLKRLAWAIGFGVALGFLSHHWQIEPLDTVLRLVFFGLAIGIPLALLLFLWAFLTRR